MIETMLDESDGTFTNIHRCLEGYEKSRTDKERLEWEQEFLHWNKYISACSCRLGNGYAVRFQELKIEQENRTYKGGPYGN